MLQRKADLAVHVIGAEKIACRVAAVRKPVLQLPEALRTQSVEPGYAAGENGEAQLVPEAILDGVALPLPRDGRDLAQRDSVEAVLAAEQLAGSDQPVLRR
jgi:hypothetical protein